MRSPTTSSVTIIAEPSGAAPMPTRRGVRATVRGAVEGERFVLDPALHGRIGRRLDLVAQGTDR